MATPSSPPKAEAPKKDLYEVLGAARDEDQHGISKKYKKLALKYHPDRNRGEGQETAAAAFREVSDAYAVLSDPNRRRQYDLHGDAGDASESNAFESVDVKSHSWAARFLLAQVSKLGMPIPTTVAADVLSRACELCEAGLAGVPPLAPGAAATGSVKISEAAFFRVHVDAATAKNGLVLAAKAGRKNDKFKLLVFDARGNVRRQAESLFPERGDRRRGAASRCRLFVVPVPTLLVGAPFSMAGEEHLPLVCAALDTLEERPACVPPFAEGGKDYLIALYSDNLLSSLDYTIAAAPAVLEPRPLKALDEAAAALRTHKETLGGYAKRYTECHADAVAKKAALDEALAKLQALNDEGKGHDDECARLRTQHDAAQRGLLDAAFHACGPPPPPPAPAKRPSGFMSAFGSRAEAPGDLRGEL